MQALHPVTWNKYKVIQRTQGGAATTDGSHWYRDGTEPMKAPNILVGMLAHKLSLCHVNTYLQFPTLNSLCPHLHTFTLLGHWNTIHGNCPCLWTRVVCGSPAEALQPIVISPDCHSSNHSFPIHTLSSTYASTG